MRGLEVEKSKVKPYYTGTILERNSTKGDGEIRYQKEKVEMVKKERMGILERWLGKVKEWVTGRKFLAKASLKMSGIVDNCYILYRMGSWS